MNTHVSGNIEGVLSRSEMKQIMAGSDPEVPEDDNGGCIKTPCGERYAACCCLDGRKTCVNALGGSECAAFCNDWDFPQ